MRAIYSRQTSGRFAGDIAESDEGEEVLDNTQDLHTKRDTTQDGEGTSPRGPVVIVDPTSTATRKNDVADEAVVGGALQRNADGSIVKPRIMKKRGTTVRLLSPLLWCNSHLSRIKTILRRWKRVPPTTLPTSADGDPESSFDSSDFAHDTSEAETQATDSNSSERPQDDVSESESGITGDESSQDTGTGLPTPAQRSVGFKQWAVSQLSTVKGYVAPIQEHSPQTRPPEEGGTREPPRPNKKRKIDSPSPAEMRGPLGKDIALPSTSFAEHMKRIGLRTEARKKVIVKRPPEVDDARLLLPIVTEEQPIMESILLNTVIVICGETGSGTTTQVPQFQFEAGIGSPDSGMLSITLPVN